ncbi:MAG: hypothetical protein K0Q79_3629 [Flavipsychrobacter sp.]|jgi:hypothetical protein|nr:hypothetical protein [Flavipsychrobacter sp.]
MQLQIDGIEFSIVRIDHQRMLFAGNSNIPYFMSWSRTKESWCFTDTDIPLELKTHETEISDFIVKYEQSIS